jgi:hypothetical protein
MVIPVYMAARTEPVNDVNRVSYILIQVKNRATKPPLSEREGIVGRHLEGDEVPAMPYITIFVQLGEGIRMDGKGEFIVYPASVRSTRSTARDILQLCITLIFPKLSFNSWATEKYQDKYDDPIPHNDHQVYDRDDRISNEMQIDNPHMSPSFFLTDSFLQELRMLLKYWPDPVSLNSKNSVVLKFMNPCSYDVTSEEANKYGLNGLI